MSNSVLVMDSVASNQHGSSLLAEEGYSVELAPNINAGLQKLNEQYPDVIIVQEIPENDIRQLCERIRSTSSVPLIVIDINASVETSAKALKAGADYFIRKPLGPLEFLARVKSLIRRSQQSKRMPQRLEAS